MNLVKKAGLGVVLAATTLTAVAPAEAQRWRGRNRGGDVAAGAVLGGIVGLGLGAAIASSNRDRYYDNGYYYGPGPRGYYAPRYRGYYAPPPPRFYRPYRGYAPRYYAPPRYRGYYGDPYYGW